MAHIPVLLQECLTVLAPKSGEKFADGTLGGGGHAREILARITPGGTLLAVDRDKRAVEATAKTLPQHAGTRVLVEAGSYAQIPKLMHQFGIEKLDGLLLDLGFSSEQIVGGTLSGRGFSFNVDEPLLMTYDDETPSLAQVLAELSAGDLATVIREYGEERYADAIAKSIAHYAKSEGIATTGKLVEAIQAAVPANYEGGRLHPATRTFQALRIYVNQELRQLESLLESLPAIMAPGGRVAIISFHSLEDRIVKHHFQAFARNKVDSNIGSRGGRSVEANHVSDLGRSGETPNTSSASRDLPSGRQVQIITKKPIMATEEELARNPRSRSAKLRAITFL